MTLSKFKTCPKATWMSLILAALLIVPAQTGMESSYSLAQKTKTLTPESIEKELKNNPKQNFAR